MYVKLWIRLSPTEWRVFKVYHITDLAKGLDKIRKVFNMDSFQITPETALAPHGKPLLNCPVNTCSTCPASFKRQCGAYKMYAKAGKATKETEVIL